MAESESIRDEMTSGDAVCVRMMFAECFLTCISAGTDGTELRRRGREPWVARGLTSAGMVGMGGFGWRWMSILPVDCCLLFAPQNLKIPQSRREICGRPGEEGRP